MITVIGGAGTRSKLREMSTSELKTPPNGAEHAGIVDRADALLAAVEPSEKAQAVAAESRELDDIVVADVGPDERTTV